MATVLSTQTDIVNAALAELGSTTWLQSVTTSEHESAVRARALWGPMVRELIASHPWNFALKRRDLNESAEPPTFGYQRRFALPEDCVRWLPPGSTSREYRRAELEGRSILADCAAPFPCRYIAMVDDVGQWPPAFVEAVKLQLAAMMAEGVTQSQSIKDRLLDRAERQLSKAKRLDGLETGNRRRGGVIGRSDWLSARHRGRGWMGR